jgi:hypothetical protein
MLTIQNKLTVLNLLTIGFCLIVPSEQLNKEYCQCRRSSRARIVGGSEVQNENIPWLVSLGKRPDNPYEKNPHLFAKNPQLSESKLFFFFVTKTNI